MPQNFPLPAHIHFIGICGRAMGALALELTRMGVRVTGSDQWVFPPMSGLLAQAGVAFHSGFAPEHLDPAPDHVIIGSYFPPSNPEVATVLDRRLPWSTLSGFIGQFLVRQTRNLVVAGTNGKTTTTAMLAWILESAGLSPSFLVAGEASNLGQMAKLRPSPWFVLEGDEYISGLGDLNPKFLHYQPERVIVTNVHWDHVEVFGSEKHYQTGFTSLLDLVPPSGGAVLNADDPFTPALVQRRKSPGLETVGFDRGANHRITALKQGRAGVSFKLLGQTFTLPAYGRINAHNAAMAATMAQQCGVDPEISATALRLWRGVAGRQEVWHQSSELTIIKEEAYHPHALKGAVEAVRVRFPRRRLVLVLQPRYTGGRKGVHQSALPEALTGVDTAIVTDALEIVPVPQPFSSRALGAALRKQGCEVKHVPKVRDVSGHLPAFLQPGDVLLVSLAYRNEAFFEDLRKAVAPTAHP